MSVLFSSERNCKSALKWLSHGAGEMRSHSVLFCELLVQVRLQKWKFLSYESPYFDGVRYSKVLFPCEK